jgi:DNA gyrase subunit A
VLNQLYKHTQMQESFSMIFLAVVNGQPKELPLHVAIQHFIDHRVDVVRRRTAYLLRKAREREHILEGYKIALDNLDRVIRIIRGSGSRAEARENLRTWSLGTEIVINLDKDTTNLNIAPGMSYRQIDAVLELQLYRLTQLSIDELLKELGRSARTSPSTNRFSRRKRSCAASSSRSWKTSGSSTATLAALRSSTRAPSCSWKI